MSEQQCVKFLTQLRGGFEFAVCTNIGHKWPIQRAGNMSGHGIERLHFTAITGGSACVNHGLIRIIDILQNVICIYQSGQRRLQLEVGLKVSDGFTGFGIFTRCLPSLQATV